MQVILVMGFYCTTWRIDLQACGQNSIKVLAKFFSAFLCTKTKLRFIKIQKNKADFHPLWLKKQGFIILPKENVFLQEQGRESQACDGKIVQRNKTWDSIASLQDDHEVSVSQCYCSIVMRHFHFVNLNILSIICFFFVIFLSIFLNSSWILWRNHCQIMCQCRLQIYGPIWQTVPRLQRTTPRYTPSSSAILFTAQ